MAENGRTPVIVVAGLPTEETARVAEAFLAPEAVLVHHDLRGLGEGVVLRELRTSTEAHTRAIELAHGCVSCTLREDVLPTLARLAQRAEVGRIVLHLDAPLEPEPVCWAIDNVVVDGVAVAEYVHIAAVVTVLDQGSWLWHATGDAALSDVDLAVTVDDDRTLAQLAVDAVEFADALVLAGRPGDAWHAARTRAVLERLAPAAGRHQLAGLDADALLAGIGDDARRGTPTDPHGPLLAGEPPLHRDCGVQLVVFTERRPFHPQRLHEIVEVLLDGGVVCTRGRFWLASQPERALWLESAGGGLRIGDAGPWLSTVDSDDWAAFSEARRAFAALDWDPRFGDRCQRIAIITDGATARELTDALHGALLDDDELAAGAEAWAHYPDPFGSWHTDPCDDLPVNEDARNAGSDAEPA